jgi:hypothetical protein
VRCYTFSACAGSPDGAVGHHRTKRCSLLPASSLLSLLQQAMSALGHFLQHGGHAALASGDPDAALEFLACCQENDLRCSAILIADPVAAASSLVGTETTEAERTCNVGCASTRC